MSTNAKPMNREERGAGSSALSDLMREMGSPNGSFDGIPPDNYLEQLDSDDPEERVHAWVRQKTIGKDARSPWAVDERGNELYLSNCAADCGYALPHAQAYVERLVKRGVIRTQKVGRNLRIGLCGKVARRGRRKKGKKQLRVQIIADYIINQINNFPTDKRERFQQAFQRRTEIKADVLAMGMAILREECDRTLFDPLYAEYGVEVKTRPDVKEKAAERKAEKPPVCEVQVKILDLDVQVTVDPEQVTEKTCTDREAASVQEPPDGASFMYLEEEDRSSAGRQSITTSGQDVPACLPPDPVPDPKPEPEQPPKLAGLRDLFPGEFLATDKLNELDGYFAAELGESHDPQAYVEFVRRRRQKGKIRAGLAFDRVSGLAYDYVEWVRDAKWRRGRAAPNPAAPGPTQEELAAMEEDEAELRRKLAEPVPKKGDTS